MDVWYQCWCWDLAKEKSISVDAVEHTLNCYSMQSIHFENQAKMYMGVSKVQAFHWRQSLEAWQTQMQNSKSKSLFPSGHCIKTDTLKADIWQIELLCFIRYCVWGDCSEYSLFIPAQQRIREIFKPRSNTLPTPVVYNHRGVTKPGLC